MDLADLQRKLLAAGRESQPPDQVPYGFETRVMARLRPSRPEDSLAWWGWALWRGAASAVAAALLLLSLVSVWPQPEEVGLSQIYDATLYSATEELSDSW